MNVNLKSLPSLLCESKRSINAHKEKLGGAHAQTKTPCNLKRPQVVILIER